MSRKTYPIEILQQFKPLQRSDGQWVIELQPGRILHWIESADGRPVTVNDSRFTMQAWDFREQAEGMILFLRRYWSQDAAEREKAENLEPITVEVDIDEARRKR